MQIEFNKLSSSAGLKDFSLSFTAEGCTVLHDPCEQLSRAILSGLVGLDDFYSGTLTLDGIIHQQYLQQNPLISTFGFVFDEGIMLANLTLRENLLLPWRKRYETEKESVFNSELAAWMKALELSVDINQRPAFVSPAQRKFVGYLRALLLNPKLILIDDPFYLLNKTERQQLYKFIQLIKPTRNLLIASADDEFTNGIATQVIELGNYCTL